MKDFTATIVKGSPRYQEWLDVLGTSEAILKHPIPQVGNFPNGEHLFYEMDPKELTGEQRARLVQHLSKKFNVPVSEVESRLDNEGCPILSDDVIVTVHNPQKWL